jgi:hypothetical protein
MSCQIKTDSTSCILIRLACVCLQQKYLILKSISELLQLYLILWDIYLFMVLSSKTFRVLSRSLSHCDSFYCFFGACLFIVLLLYTFKSMISFEYCLRSLLLFGSQSDLFDCRWWFVWVSKFNFTSYNPCYQLKNFTNA